MIGCPDCQKRSLWAYRTYRVHLFIITLPKASNTGLPFNFSFKAVLRWFCYKFVIGNMASYWYKQILLEGKRIHEYNTTTSTTETKMS